MLLLETLLKQSDFIQAVNGLASEFREKYQLPKLTQLGLITKDIEKAKESLKNYGIGPFFTAHGSPIYWHEKGEAKKVFGKLATAYFHGIEMELIELTEGTTLYSQYLDSEDRIVVHHLGFYTPKVDHWAEQVKTNCPLWVRLKLKFWTLRAEVAYMDALEQTGFILEFYHWHHFGIKFRLPRWLLYSNGSLQKLLGIKSFPA